MDRAYRLNPLDPIVIAGRAAALLQEGRALDAVAFFNIWVRRFDTAEANLKKARLVVRGDYPSLKLLEG